ncbi:hypothetical protein [Nonomuraea sp. GTA35]|uniref:hypothetical protein n=1 Tax=Nonomuraea sp. GTA35 TaxID=1676746 RepID=UPI0035C0559E
MRLISRMTIALVGGALLAACLTAPALASTSTSAQSEDFLGSLVSQVAKITGSLMSGGAMNTILPNGVLG